ncbi:MAG TPA: LuxR C-terminal-related transcriptional regulator [Parafilimonas sp.]|nr:LuxR C-terminal-related transcriptional regulator [Parafilimonas sp.]
MPARKPVSYTSLISDVFYRSRDIDTKELHQLLNQAEAIPQSLLPFKGIIHVIDYTQRRHVGISGDIVNMIGYKPEQVIENGLDFVVDIFQKDDFKLYNEKMFTKAMDFLINIPHEEHDQYIFSYGYRMRKSDGNYIHLFQQGTYVTDIKTKLPLYGIGVVADISPVKKDVCMIFSIDKKNKGSLLRYNNITTEYYYPDPDEAKLSKREKEIVGRLADGLSSKAIADRLYVSESTVVNHRKNMLKKTNTKNVAELIQYAIKKGII